jgi:hypothetical protein
MGWLASVLSIINQKLDSVLTFLRSIQHTEAIQKTQLDLLLQNQAADHILIVQNNALTVANNELLTQIAKELTPPLPTKVKATITLDQLQGEDDMARKAAKAGADLVVNEVTGTFTVTLTFEDADDASVPTPAGLSASYQSSDASPGPSIFNLTPSADTSSCAGAVNQTQAKALNDAGTPLPTGLIISGTVTWTGLASPIPFTASPALDVAAGAAGQVVAVASEP